MKKPSRLDLLESKLKEEISDRQYDYRSLKRDLKEEVECLQYEINKLRKSKLSWKSVACDVAIAGSAATVIYVVMLIGRHLL